MKRKIILAATVLLGVTTLLVTVSAFRLYHFANSSMLPPGESFEVELKSGSSLNGFANQLLRDGIITSRHHLVWLTMLRGDATRLQSGEYYFPAGTTPLQFITKIRKGYAIKHRITFPEGIRFQDMLQIIRKHPRLKQSVVSLPEAEIAQQVGSEQQSLEGLFYPDTYLFYKGTQDKTILKKAFKKMQSVLDEEWQLRNDNGLYKTPQEALTAASLVEKETAVDSERFMVATVIANRLRINMPLQIDPTVIYALGADYSGRLTRTNLKTLSPYNTYVTRGLPPTPIALPSRKSIHATLHPLQNNYIYYVSKGDGTHIFAETLAEHNRNVAWSRAQQKRKDAKDPI